MSGHSKWSQIKRKKQAKDQLKGSLFSKISREITLAVVQGRGIVDPDLNLKLRMVIEKAKRFNMPKSSIDKAIKRGVGPEKDRLKEIIYEGFVSDGISLIIVTATDNNNRTYNSIRQTLNKYGGKLADQGSVSYMFKKCGLIVFEKAKVMENQVFSLSEKIVAFDIEQDKDHYYLYFPFENIGKVSDINKDVQMSVPEIDYKPQNTILVNDQVKAKKILSLIEALEELDDVQQVFSNFDIPEDMVID